MSIRNKLRIGILINGLNLPLWKYRALEKVAISDFAEVILLINNNFNSSIKRKKSNLAGYSVLSLYEKADRLIFKRKLDFSIKKDASSLFTNVDRLDLQGTKDFSETVFNNEEISEIKQFNLSVIINLGSTGLKENYPGLAKYGIWSFYLIDDWIIKGTLNGFWELAIKCNGCEFIPEEIPEDTSKGIILYRSVEPTDDLSLNINKNKLFWRASLFIPRILKGIYTNGERYLNYLMIKYNNKISVLENKSTNLPSLTPTVSNFFSNIKNRIKYKILYTGNLSWFVFFGNYRFLTSLNSLQRLNPPSNNRFWADPFALSCDGKDFIFVEELFYKKNMGHISMIELDKNGKPIVIERILEKPYHLSYPFIFETGNNYYMIPETSANRTIDLYKCTCFPNKWEFVKNILKDLRAVDTTIFYYKNYWWLFTSIDETGGLSGCSTELFLFFSDNLFSDQWKSHPQNPILTDVRTARPAGKIFVNDGKMYRPSQDCSGRYGKALNICQILKLTESEYEETPVYRMTPDWDNSIKGIHTYNFDNNFIVTDAYSYRKRTLLHLR